MDNGGTFGFNGAQNRGFDFPAGVLDDFSVGVSKPGRARLRYNDVTKALELSVDGGGFAVVTTGGGSSPWVEVAGLIRPQNATDDVVIGAAALVGTETFRVVGDARFEPDDSAGGFVVVDGASSPIFSATAAGDVIVNNELAVGQVDIAERVGDPGASANFGKVYTKDDGGGVTELFYQDSAGNVTRLTAGGGVAAAGNDRTVQFNDSGLLAGDNNLTWDAASGLLLRLDIQFTSGASLDAATADPLEIGNTNATQVNFTPPVSLLERVGDPGATANQGKVYSKDVSTVTELYYQDSAGNVVQLTAAGSLAIGAVADTHVLYSNNGVIDGNAGLTYDGTELTVASELQLDNGIYMDPLGVSGAVIRIANSNNDAFFVRNDSTGANYIQVATLASPKTIYGNYTHSHEFHISPSRTDAFRVEASGATNERYLDIDTVNDLFYIGNTNKALITLIQGVNSSLRLNEGSVMEVTERVADPGATANIVKIYAKDVAGVTELFVQRSDGTVTQIS